MKIITNNHFRPVLSWHELTTKEQDFFKTIEEAQEWLITWQECGE